MSHLAVTVPLQLNPSFIFTAYSFCFEKVYAVTHKIHVFVMEANAIFGYVFPAAVQWWISRVITKKIGFYPIELTVEGKAIKASLYYYKELNIVSGKKTTPILLMHGDHSHPYTMSHLAEIAQKSKKGPVFSLYLPSSADDKLFAAQTALIGTVIDKIEAIVKKNKGIIEGIKAVGHSKGGMLLANRLFKAKKQPRITSLFAIATRLYSPKDDFTCKEPLKSIVNTIYRRIFAHPERSLIQIVPKDDWNAPQKGMKVRPCRDCFEVSGSHLSGLYSSFTSDLFSLFVNSSQKKKEPLVSFA